MNGRLVAIGLAVASSSFGCASDPEPRPPKQDDGAIADPDACGVLCGRLESCGGAPDRCAQDCEEGRVHLRPGVMGSFAACVRAQLVAPGCTSAGPVDRKARAGTIAMCYSATVSAWAEKDHGAAIGVVLASMCRRRANCAGTVVDEAACVAELSKHEGIRAASKLLAVARPEDVASIASCAEKVPCDDPSPIDRCNVASSGATP